MTSEAFKILTFETIDSTNKRAKEIATQGAELKTVVVARSQIEGRGRGLHQWHSPPGGLYFSVLLAPKQGRRPTDLAILAGTALSQGIKDLLPKSKTVTVKWPNDCLIGWKKVAGVLCESVSDGKVSTCVVGMGVNINLSERELQPFLVNPFSATSFQIENMGHYDLDHCLDIILSKLLTLYELYHAEGFAPIQYLWEKNCRFVGKKIELKDSAGARDSHSTIGTCLGIDGEGGLVVSNAKGERAVFYNGELTCFWP